jgi:hypothetical protein
MTNNPIVVTLDQDDQEVERVECVSMDHAYALCLQALALGKRTVILNSGVKVNDQQS